MIWTIPCSTKTVLICVYIYRFMRISKLEAQVGQKSSTWLRLIMICYIVPGWPSWLSDQIAFSNSESDVVWRVSKLPPWPLSWILEPVMFKLSQTYRSVADVNWSFSRWLSLWPSWMSEWNHFSNSISPCCHDAFRQVSALSDVLFGSRKQLKTFKLAAMDSDGDVEKVKCYWPTYRSGTDYG